MALSANEGDSDNKVMSAENCKNVHGALWAADILEHKKARLIRGF